MAAGQFSPGFRVRKNRRMTERKSVGESFESWIDKQIRTAQERGDFDNLPGAGKPIPGLGGPNDELWWVRSYLRREGLSTEALLPTPLQLRKEIERLADTVRPLRSEQDVREVVDQLNRRIVAWLRAPVGPQVPVGRVDAENVVARWRADRALAAEKTAAARTAARAAVQSQPPARWWQRFGPQRGLAGGSPTAHGLRRPGQPR